MEETLELLRQFGYSEHHTLRKEYVNGYLTTTCHQYSYVNKSSEIIFDLYEGKIKIKYLKNNYKLNDELLSLICNRGRELGLNACLEDVKGETE